MDGPPSPDMRIGGAQQRRASAAKRQEAVDRIDRNKTDAIEWAKQRRAKAAAAEAKREERRRAEAAAIKAQEEYEDQLEQYKQRGYAPSHAFEVNEQGDSSAEPASWEDTPIGAAVPSRARAREQRLSSGGGGQSGHPQQQRRRQQQHQQADGPFGRTWNDGFADSPGWSMMSDGLLDEDPVSATTKSPAYGRGRGRNRGRGRGRAGGDRRGSEPRAPRSSLKSVKEDRERRKQAEQESHEKALRQARIQAAAERRLAAERARTHGGDGALSPRTGARSPGVDAQLPGKRHSPTLTAKQRGAAVVPRTRSRSPRAPAEAEAVRPGVRVAHALCGYSRGQFSPICLR